MNVTLDETLIARERAARHATMRSLSAGLERIAAQPPVAKEGPCSGPRQGLSQCSKNTIYYNCLTGDAPSYPASGSNKAREINEIIDRMGEDAAWREHVTSETMIPRCECCV